MTAITGVGTALTFGFGTFVKSADEIERNEQLVKDLKTNLNSLPEGEEKLSRLLEIQAEAQKGYEILYNRQKDLFDESNKEELDMSESNVLGSLTGQLEEYRALMASVTEQVVQNCVNIALAHGDSFDAVKQLLVTNNIELTEEELTHWENKMYALEHNLDQLFEMYQNSGIEVNELNKKAYVDLLTNAKDYHLDLETEQGKANALLYGMMIQQGIDINSIQMDQYRQQIENAISNGQTIGKDYISSMISSMEDNKENVNAKVSETLDQTQAYLDENPANMNVEVQAPSKNTLSNIFSGITNTIASFFRFSFDGFADGGFPNVGQLFIANEPGNPELIGNIGGRTAVVNNKMILEGIEASMFNGIVKGMQEAQAYQGNHGTNITEVYLDGELIDRRIKKANEKQLLRVGKPIYLK